MYIHIFVSLNQTTKTIKSKIMIKTLSISAVAIAAMSLMAFTGPKEKKVTAYSVDTKATTTNWVGKKVTGQHNGKIHLSKGTINAEQGAITSGTVEFDMTSITNEDLADKEWNDKLIGHLKSDDFFGVEKFPTAKFEITKVTAQKDNDFNVTGKLTIKGITEELTFPAKIKMDDKKMVVIAKILVNRTKYGIKYNSASFFDSIGDKAIDDNFELDVDLIAVAGK